MILLKHKQGPISLLLKTAHQLTCQMKRPKSSPWPTRPYLSSGPAHHSYLLTSYPSLCSLNQPHRPPCCSTNRPGTFLPCGLCCSYPLCWNALPVDISSANTFTSFLKLSLLNEFYPDYSVAQSGPPLSATLNRSPSALLFTFFHCIYDILTYHIIYLLCLLSLLCFTLNTCYVPRRNGKNALLSIGLWPGLWGQSEE